MSERMTSEQTAAYFKAYKAQIRQRRIEHEAFSAEVPVLEDVVEAFMADEVESWDLDVLIGAAIFGVAIQIPLALQRRVYERRQSQVRFTDTPGQITKYRRIKPRHARNFSAVLKEAAMVEARGAYGPAQFMPEHQARQLREFEAIKTLLNGHQHP